MLTTAGSSFDTILAVYRGTSLTGLTAVAGNDDFGGALTSRVTFSAVAGTTYRIAVAGYRNPTCSITRATGSVTLNWTGPRRPPPAATSSASSSRLPPRP